LKRGNPPATGVVEGRQMFHTAAVAGHPSSRSGSGTDRHTFGRFSCPIGFRPTAQITMAVLRRRDSSPGDLTKKGAKVPQRLGFGLAGTLRCRPRLATFAALVSAQGPSGRGCLCRCSNSVATPDDEPACGPGRPFRFQRVDKADVARRMGWLFVWALKVANLI